MTNWFQTKKQALRELEHRGLSATGQEVFKWTITKRKKPFFVGSYFEFVNTQ